MSNLNLKSKLILLLLFPVIGLLFLSITISYDRYQIYTKLEMLNKVILLSTKTKTLIYSLQKERGFSNGYIGSKGKSFYKEIINQKKETLQQQKELNNFLKNINIDYYGNDFKNTFIKAISELNNINRIHKKIMDPNVDENEINSYYNRLITTLIETITYTSNFSNNSIVTKQLYSYSNFIYAIERTANERGLGTLAFSSKEFSLDMKKEYHKLISEQDIYLKLFEKNLDKKSLDFYRSIFKSKAYTETIKMRKSLLTSIDKKLIMSKINGVIGYNGIIHNHNKYLLTKDLKYLEEIKKQYNYLVNLINEYKAMGYISDKEKQLLKKVKTVFNSYIYTEIQTDIRIDERNILNELTHKNFFSNNSAYWFDMMTERISLLQEIDNHLIKQILQKTKLISNNAKVDMNSYIILCLIIILAVLFIGRNISINIVNSANNLLEGIDRFFKFVNKKSDHLKLIEIKSNDEIGAISKMINEKIAISKKIIDEDIIERAKQLELEVKKKTNDLEIKNKKYKLLLDRFNTHVTATRTDTRGIITFVTDKFCRVSGYTKEELLGQNHNIVRHPDVSSDTYRELWATIQTGENYIGEIRNKRKDGTEYWIKLLIVPEFDSNKNIIGYFSVKEDIEDKIKIREFNTLLEEKIQQAIEESRKKDELLSHQSKLATIGEMIGIIAHQWKQPLSSLSMRIQAIKIKNSYAKETIDDEYIESFVSENMELIQFMTKTIDDFRDFFRQDKAKEDFNIINCINKTLNIVKPQLKDARIDLDIKGEDFTTNGLQSEFQQVIVNLISNARDVLIEKEIENKKIKIYTEIKGNKGILFIEDNAGGIKEDILDKIFEPYFTTKGVGKGTGIGLYISKTIIEDTMNGELAVSNTKNGACFRIIMNLV